MPLPCLFLSGKVFGPLAFALHKQPVLTRKKARGTEISKLYAFWMVVFSFTAAQFLKYLKCLPKIRVWMLEEEDLQGFFFSLYKNSSDFHSPVGTTSR